MLQLQVINENPEHVIERLAVKHFDAREPIMRIVELDKQRRAAQKQRPRADVRPGKAKPQRAEPGKTRGGKHAGAAEKKEVKKPAAQARGKDRRAGKPAAGASQVRPGSQDPLPASRQAHPAKARQAKTQAPARSRAGTGTPTPRPLPQPPAPSLPKR